MVVAENDTRNEIAEVWAAANINKNRLYKGKVVDEKTSEPLVGATVKVKGSTIGTITDIEERTTGLPKSNVLYYELEDNNWCCVRPSGTEPLVRVMIEGKDKEVIREKAQKIADLIEKNCK